MYSKSAKNRGFTLIELLVVIAIIGTLASVVLASLNNARANSRNAARVSNLKELQKAVELYQLEHGEYPRPGNMDWQGDYVSCSAGWATQNLDWIPGLVSGGFIASLPSDPNATGCSNYIYRSDGDDYKIMINGIVEGDLLPQSDPLSRCASGCTQTFCTNPGRNYAVYSGGAGCW